MHAVTSGLSPAGPAVGPNEPGQHVLHECHGAVSPHRAGAQGGAGKVSLRQLSCVAQLLTASAFRFQGELYLSRTSGVGAQSVTAALRDLYGVMDRSAVVPPIVMLQVLHMAFPRFSEKSEHGGFTQQVRISLRSFCSPMAPNSVCNKRPGQYCL